MSLLWDVVAFFFSWIGLIPSAFLLIVSYRKRNKNSTPLEHARFKQLRKDIKTIKKLQPKSHYQSSKVLEEIFSYMPTRSWNFDGHTEFGTNQKQYYWSAPSMREGKLLTVTVAWNTKWSQIDYISTRVEDAKVSTYSPGCHPS